RRIAPGRSAAIASRTEYSWTEISAPVMKKLLSEVVGCRARPLYPSRRRSARIVSTIAVRRGPPGGRGRSVAPVVVGAAVQPGPGLSAIPGARTAPLPGGGHQGVVVAGHRAGEEC